MLRSINSLCSGPVASIAIHGSDGRLIHRQELRIQGERNQYSWNNRSMNGAAIIPDAYIVSIVSKEVRMTKRFTVMF
jgi:hypothetical protein